MESMATHQQTTTMHVLKTTTSLLHIPPTSSHMAWKLWPPTSKLHACNPQNAYQPAIYRPLAGHNNMDQQPSSVPIQLPTCHHQSEPHNMTHPPDPVTRPTAPGGYPLQPMAANHAGKVLMASKTSHPCNTPADTRQVLVHVAQQQATVRCHSPIVPASHQDTNIPYESGQAPVTQQQQSPDKDHSPATPAPHQQPISKDHSPVSMFAPRRSHLPDKSPTMGPQGKEFLEWGQT